jgi:hypothetical protein
MGIRCLLARGFEREYNASSFLVRGISIHESSCPLSIVHWTPSENAGLRVWGFPEGDSRMKSRLLERGFIICTRGRKLSRYFSLNLSERFFYSGLISDPVCSARSKTKGFYGRPFEASEKCNFKKHESDLLAVLRPT